MKEKLKEFISVMEIVKEEYDLEEGSGCRRNGKWWASIDLPFSENDFNKEIVDPNINEDYPEGAVGIRVDDDFWQVAALPLEFKDLSIQEMVEVLWPEEKKPTFNPDVIALELRRPKH